MHLILKIKALICIIQAYLRWKANLAQPSSVEDTFTMNVGIEDERAVENRQKLAKCSLMEKALENYVIFKGFEIRHINTRSYKIKSIHKV